MGPAVHEALAEAIVDEGVEVAFALMGDGNKRLLADLAGAGVRLVQARHEGAALAMADGYARVSGRPGFCAVTYGPGVAQLSTSLLVARTHGTPLVVFAADAERATRDGGGPLDVDERALLQAAGAAVHEVCRPQDAVRAVRAAFALARARSRPSALLVAVDLQDERAPEWTSDPSPGARTLPSSGWLDPGAGPVPDPGALRRAASLLRRARRPLVLAGAGARGPGVREATLALADELDARVATTFGAKGLFDRHPRDLGVVGGFGLEASRQVVRHADALLALGAGLNAHTTEGGALFSAAAVVQVDRDPSAPLRAAVPVALALHADAGQAAEGLRRELAERRGAEGGALGAPAAVGGGGWDEVAGLRVDPRLAQLERVRAAREPDRLDPRLALLRLDEMLPDDAVVVVGGGHFMAFAVQFLSNPGRRSFEMVFDAMTTGQALPEAIGAAVGVPDRPVVAVEGDASFLMHVGEVETAVRSGVGLGVVVIDDGALGAEYHKLAALGLDAALALAPGPDLGRVAEALGGAGRRVTSLEQLDTLGPWLVGGGVRVLDCAVTRSVVGPL
jgi:acetolactate synthase-1/2/3 large subunit